MKFGRSIVLSAAVASAVVMSTTPAYADTVPKEARATWQTNGALDDRGKNPTGTVYVTLIGKGASDGLVFIAGNFASLKAPAGKSGTIGRVGVAALNKATGAPVATFDAKLAVGSGRVEIRALELSGDGSTLYVGGRLDTASGQPRKNLVAVSALTGAPRSFVSHAASDVKALAISGNRLFVGGDFGMLNGQSRGRLAAVDATTGAVAAWRADVGRGDRTCPPHCAPNVMSMDVVGSTLYVGGHFGKVSGIVRNSAAAVDTTTGAVKAWNPNVIHDVEGRPGAANRVYDIEAWNDRVFVCGDFWAVGGQIHPNIAAVDPVTGQNKSGWVSSTDGAVNACDINPASGVLYLGGHFDKAGGPAAGQLKPGWTVRRHVVKLNPVTGVPIAGWDPVLNSVPGVYALDSELNRVVVGGQFTLVNGKAQQGVAFFD